MKLLILFVVAFSCSCYCQSSEIQELEDCLSKLLISQHKLQTLKINITGNLHHQANSSQLEMMQFQLEETLNKTNSYVEQLQYRLRELYLAQDLHSIVSEVNQIHELFSKIDGKTPTPSETLPTSHSSTTSTEKVTVEALSTEITPKIPDDTTTSNVPLVTTKGFENATEPITTVPKTMTKTEPVKSTDQVKISTSKEFTTNTDIKGCTCPPATSSFTTTQMAPTTAAVCAPAAGIIIRAIVVPAAASLITKFGPAFKTYLENVANAASIVVIQPHPGAVWISILGGTWGTWNDQVCSLYFHPTRKHSATTIGKLGEKRSVADACKWATSCQTRALFGNKSFFDTL